MIGAITMAWTSLEYTLAVQYSLLAQAVKPYSTEADQISMETFELVESLRQRKDILLASAKHRLSSALVDKYGELLEKVEAAYILRNRIAHGKWFISKRHPKSLVHTRRIMDFDNARIYSPKMLMDLFNAIVQAHHNIEQFFASKAVPELKARGDHFVEFVSSLKNKQKRRK